MKKARFTTEQIIALLKEHAARSSRLAVPSPPDRRRWQSRPAPGPRQTRGRRRSVRHPSQSGSPRRTGHADRRSSSPAGARRPERASGRNTAHRQVRNDRAGGSSTRPAREHPRRQRPRTPATTRCDARYLTCARFWPARAGFANSAISLRGSTVRGDFGPQNRRWVARPVNARAASPWLNSPFFLSPFLALGTEHLTFV